MGRSPSTCAVILAAGASTRMGRDKALLPWPPTAANPAAGDSFLSAAIRALTPHVEMVLVVAGHNAAQLAPVIYANGASLVENPDSDRGQFSSLQVGLHEVLSRGRDAATVTLVDRPPARSATLEFLGEAFAGAIHQGKWAVVPEFDGKHGHPIFIAREMIEAFLRAPTTSSAREVEHQNQAHVLYVPVDDPFVALNVDTPEDYAALSRPAAPHPA
jgi:molybdenum cofactor cytidylyltransferase